MEEHARVDTSIEATAALAGALLAIDPRGLGGAILLRPMHQAARSWSAHVRHLIGAHVPLRRLPVNATDDRVLGGLDLAATLSTGARVVMRGVLAEADGGVIVMPLAERTLPGTVSALAEALDSGEVIVERDGVAARHEARIMLVAMDETTEGIGDIHVAPTLADRLAFQIAIPHQPIVADLWPTLDEIAAARACLPNVSGERGARMLCAVSSALGVESLRAVVLAMRCARAHAALQQHLEVTDDDVTIATQLVLAPRATRVPPPPDAPDAESAPPPEPQAREHSEEQDGEGQTSEGIPDEILLAAVRAMLPPDVLEATNAAAKRRAQSAGRRGRENSGGERGRQMRAAPGRLESGKKLDPVATLRVAAPWQALRRREQDGRHGAKVVDVRRDDFRIRRYKRQTGTTTIIAVDASGSMAMQRLAEAKGAVELLLGQTYVRRDRVALIGFRGEKATLLLPPTRALARAKRVMAALPGGGGTPLASAIELVHATAMSALRDGQDVVMVLLTDARANIARDGTPGGGRAKAMDDARRAARALRALMQTTVMIDTSPRGEPNAKELAMVMGARYVPLPAAQAREVAKAVRAERAS